MNDQLHLDAKDASQLFFWKGAIDPDRLNQWIEGLSLAVPTDLVELWVRTGGGDLFESETVLTPMAGADDPVDIEASNACLRSQGLPCQFCVFHIGTLVSAVRQPDAVLVELDESSYQEIKTFASLDEWYRQTIRDEFAARYGL